MVHSLDAAGGAGVPNNSVTKRGMVDNELSAAHKGVKTVILEEEPTFPPFEYADMLSDANFGDWRDDLVTKGYAVVPAIEREKALQARAQGMAWLEEFGRGFDRNDPSTFKAECLPADKKGGMIHSFGVQHEQWVWDLATAPGVIDAFAKIWGTRELVRSFDAVSLMMPGRKDVKDGGRWPHADHSPARRGIYVVQGIMNLNVNGPDDGGLMVLEGSSKLFEEFFDMVGRRETRTWGPVDWYGFTAEQEQWFYDRGCKWVKVCAQPGDLLLWDSRTLHYNVPPTGNRDRSCTYVCMAPAKLLSDDDRKKRTDAFNECRGTTHVPFASIYSKAHRPAIRGDTGEPDPMDTGKPRNPRKPTDLVLKLAGVKAY